MSLWEIKIFKVMKEETDVEFGINTIAKNMWIYNEEKLGFYL